MGKKPGAFIYKRLISIGFFGFPQVWITVLATLWAQKALTA
jgi:hypothetical protein